MSKLLQNEEVETLFRVEASLRNEQNHWFYRKEIPSLLEHGLLVERNDVLQLTPKGKAYLLLMRNGPLEN